MEVVAMTAGPVRNLTTIAKVATKFPHAMILSYKAMNRPRLNMATSRPASNRIKMDFAMRASICTFHLNEIRDQVSPIKLE